MTVELMLDEIVKSKNKTQIASHFLQQCIQNAAILALKNIKHFDSVEACLQDACMQYEVLKDCLANSEKYALYMDIPYEAVEAFQLLLPDTYRELERLVNDTNKKRLVLTT